MNYYPMVLIPKPIQKARVIQIHTEDDDNFDNLIQTTEPSRRTTSIKFNKDGKPIKPRLKVVPWIMAEATVISIIAVTVGITFNKVVGILLLVTGTVGTGLHLTVAATQFKARWKAYQAAMQEFNGSKKSGKSAATIAKERAVAEQTEATTKARERAKLVKEVLKQTVTADGRDSLAKRGRSEASFEMHLRSYFPGMVHTGLTCTIPNFATPYTPDFAVIESSSKLHLDVEIDEPYNSEGEPVHYVGLDDRRNEFFLNWNWIVVRFAEEQVIKHPEACCKLIARIIADVVGAPTGSPQAIALNQLKDVKPAPKVKQWNQKEAKAMAKRKHRGSY